MKSLICVILLLFLVNVSTVTAQNSLQFNNLDSLLAYVEAQSYALKSGNQQQYLAKLQLWAAKGNVFNPRLPVTATITDNTQLPVSFLPAEIFGGKPNTFREVTMGQEYISSVALMPQFDLINPASIARIESAKISKQIADNNQLLTQKTLLETTTAIYYNVLSLKAQREIVQKNLSIADSISQIVKNRIAQGIARPQDANEAEVNVITLKDKISQLDYTIENQYNSLKVLCELPMENQIIISAQLPKKIEESLSSQSDLLLRSAILQQQLAKAESRAAKWSQLPVLSFVSSFSWQNNSNNNFFDNKARWINANYWGLRLTFNLPTDINKYTASQTAQIQYRISSLNVAHQQIQNQATNQQLDIDFKKYHTQYQNFMQIFNFKKDSYHKSFNQYQENILPLDRLLVSHNDVLLSELNLIMALASVHYSSSKIYINNKIK